MRIILLILLLVLGVMSVDFEFRAIQERDVFTGDITASIPFYSLCAITLYYLIRSITDYRHHKKLVAFIPSVIGLIFMGIIFSHKVVRSNQKNYQTLFSARSDEFGTDGGLRLEFKENMVLFGEKIDRFSNTTYWGTYKQEGDSITIDIPLDFKLCKRAILQDSILYFPEDSLRFEVFQNKKKSE